MSGAVVHVAGLTIRDVTGRAVVVDVSFRGQQQRVALASNPSVLILDEPTTGLDVVIQELVLTELAAQRRLASRPSGAEPRLEVGPYWVCSSCSPCANWAAATTAPASGCCSAPARWGRWPRPRRCDAVTTASMRGDGRR